LFVCEAWSVSRRDLAHVLQALWKVSGGVAGVGVALSEVEDAIGRSRGDMRTLLNLQSLAAEGTAVQLDDGTWALTLGGVDVLEQDRELSDR